MKNTLTLGLPQQGWKEIVAALNEVPAGWKAQEHENLKRLIDAWQISGPNLHKMQYPEGCPRLEDIGKECRVIINTSEGPQAYWVIVYGPKRPWNEWDRACEYFVRLITSDTCWQLGGPCPRCSKYFLRKTAKRSVYCSRKCASLATATAATGRRRSQNHSEKLRRIVTAQHEWQRYRKTGRTKLGWKEWIAKLYPADVTIKFLTRAVTNGVLQDPAEEPKKGSTK